MKFQKNIPLIDQHDKYGFWGGKFGGSFIPETLKKPVEDLTISFSKLRKNSEFLKKKNFYFSTIKKLFFGWHSGPCSYWIYFILNDFFN